jgi:hypothetical protein
MLATRLCAALALLAQIQATTSMHPPSQREAQMVLRCWIPSWVSDKHATCGHIACRCATGSTLAPIASVGVLRLRGAGGDSTESDDYAGDEVIVDGMVAAPSCPGNRVQGTCVMIGFERFSGYSRAVVEARRAGARGGV